MHKLTYSKSEIEAIDPQVERNFTKRYSRETVGRLRLKRLSIR